MDETLKMMAEYILEENVSQKEEIRRLNEELREAKNDNDYWRDIGARVNALRKIIAKNINWTNGKPSYLSIYNEEVLATICSTFGITENDKAFL